MSGGSLFVGSVVLQMFFNLGQCVCYSLFGEGIIFNFEGVGVQVWVQVNFENEGSKWLMLVYVKLEVCQYIVFGEN